MKKWLRTINTKDKIKFSLLEKVGLGISIFFVFAGCFTCTKSIKKSLNEPPREVNVDVEKLLENVGENQDEDEVLRFIHQLMHPLITTNDKKEWGTQAVTKENIGNALILIEDINYIYFYDELKDSLLKMCEGNFEDAVRIHNLMWNYQGGTIGRATGLDNEEISIITEKNFQ